MVQFLDQLVAGGQAASRASVVERALAREFRRVIAARDAAILAARRWHEGKAQQAIVQSRRTRFPKNLERESEVHRHSAEMMMTLSPDDV